ncbi:MAG: hypothetical protein JXA25_01265 [Anaerolineales bacterium]|nr:hypothetical protein [Anaerolineales bacterium]
MFKQKAKYFYVILALVSLLIASLACGPSTVIQDNSDAESPLVVITSPEEGAVFSVGETVQVAIAAQYEPGMERVELIVNGTKAAELSASDPTESGMMSTFEWTAEEEGNYVLTVVAYGVENAISSPAYLNIVVEPLEVAGLTENDSSGEGVSASETPPTASPPTAAPPTESAPPTDPPCTMNAAFVTDVTIPDGSEIAAGTDFTKTWRIRNSGTCDWDGVQLVYSSGNQMNGPSVTTVPDTSPGSEVDVSVNLKAPSDPDDYTSYWRLRNNGAFFGTNLIVVITVPEEEGDDDGFIWGIEPGIMLMLPSISNVVEQESIPAGSSASSTAQCPSGSIVTGGGYAAQDGLFIYNSSKSGNGWRVYAQNNTGSNKPLNAYAVCMHNTSGSSSQILNQVSVSGGAIGHAVAACPAGSVLTSGGFAGRHDGGLFIYNSSRSGNGWQIYAENTTGSSIPLNAYAICVSGISASSTSKLTQVTVNHGLWNVAEAQCSSGLRTGGGFAAVSNPDVFVYNTSPDTSDPTMWRTYASNNSGTSALLNSYAICTTFE